MGVFDSFRASIDPVLGLPKRHVPGGETDYWCPFCNASHLHVNYNKGRALCHGCGRGFTSLRSLIHAIGGVLPDMRRFDDGDSDLVDVVDQSTRTRPTESIARKVDMPAYFEPIVYPCANDMQRIVSRYLRGRGFTKEDIVEYGIGCCTDGNMRGYAIFPVVVNKRLVTWTSRRVVAFNSKQLHAPDSDSRYALFNYDRCGDCRRIILCEGPFDAKAVHRRVRRSDGGIGVLGTSLSAEKVSALCDLPAEEFVVLMDGDGPGRVAALKMSEKLVKADRRVRMAFPPDGIDPDEMDDDDLRALVNSAPIVDESELELMKCGIL